MDRLAQHDLTVFILTKWQTEMNLEVKFFWASLFFFLHPHTFLLAVAPLADLHGGGEAEARDRHVHGDPRRHLGVLCNEKVAGNLN